MRDHTDGADRNGNVNASYSRLAPIDSIKKSEKGCNFCEKGYNRRDIPII